MDETTQDILQSVVETLMKKEATKFRGLIQKELASKVHAKIEELKKALSAGSIGGQPSTVSEIPMAPSAPVATSPTNTAGAADAGGLGAPAPVKPLKEKDIKIVPTAAGANKDDVSLDPNFEKEFYVTSYDYKGQKVIVKQVGTGFGKPVRIYINDRRWEFFPGPKTAAKATRDYIDGMMADAKKDPQLAHDMTNKITSDKKQGVAAAPPQADNAKDPKAAAAAGKPPMRFKKK
jgi:hypothetical protein